MAKRANVITRKSDACCSVVAAMYADDPTEMSRHTSGLPPLPRAKQTRLLQAEVDVELYEAIRVEMDNREIKMRDVADWALRAFLHACHSEAPKQSEEQK